MTLPPHTADALTRLALALARAEDLDAVLWAVAHEAIGTLKLEDCVVYLVDHDRRLCIQRAAYGPKNPQGFDILHPIQITVGQGIVGEVAASARAIRVDDTRADPRYIVDDASRASELAVPIVHRGQVIGVLDSEHSQPAFLRNPTKTCLRPSRRSPPRRWPPPGCVRNSKRHAIALNRRCAPSATSS